LWLVCRHRRIKKAVTCKITAQENCYESSDIILNIIIHEVHALLVLDGNATHQNPKIPTLQTIEPKQPIPYVRMSQYLLVQYLLVVQTAGPASAPRVVSVMVVVMASRIGVEARLSAILTLHCLLFLVLLVMML
jgi:hypothetical protein